MCRRGLHGPEGLGAYLKSIERPALCVYAPRLNCGMPHKYARSRIQANIGPSMFQLSPCACWAARAASIGAAASRRLSITDEARSSSTTQHATHHTSHTSPRIRSIEQSICAAWHGILAHCLRKCGITNRNVESIKTIGVRLRIFLTRQEPMKAHWPIPWARVSCLPAF